MPRLNLLFILSLLLFATLDVLSIRERNTGRPKMEVVAACTCESKTCIRQKWSLGATMCGRAGGLAGGQAAERQADLRPGKWTWGQAAGKAIGGANGRADLAGRRAGGRANV